MLIGGLLINWMTVPDSSLYVSGQSISDKCQKIKFSPNQFVGSQDVWWHCTAIWLNTKEDIFKCYKILVMTFQNCPHTLKAFYMHYPWCYRMNILPLTIFHSWFLKNKVMFLCPALALPLLMNRYTIWHYRTMNADTWIRNQFLNKRLMLTTRFFPLVIISCSSSVISKRTSLAWSNGGRLTLK